MEHFITLPPGVRVLQRRCAICGKKKVNTRKCWIFDADETLPDGRVRLSLVCRRCANSDNPEKARARSRRWYAANTDKVREGNRRWYAANPDKARARSRRWREANPEKVRAANRRWREANPDKVRARSRRWREANPEKVRARSRRWREANPEKVRAANRRLREANPDKVREGNRRLRAAKIAQKYAGITTIRSLSQRHALLASRYGQRSGREALGIEEQTPDGMEL